MKILVCHNRYQLAGGEDTVVAMETDLLKQHGHTVQLYEVSNTAINSIARKIKTGLNVSYSETSKKELSRVLDDFKPDIVHFHNTFPLLTPSVYDACIEHSTPVVQTLHNYRTICPGALLMRDGKVCELCIKGSPFNATRYGCYRNSKLQSFAVSKMVIDHRNKGTWQHKVNRFIALTGFSRDKFTEAGFPIDKISVKPNFIIEPELTLPNDTKDYALYVGRISTEKGLHVLCQAFSKLDIPLKIAGDGPLLTELQQQKHPNIEFLGSQSQDQIYHLMAQARYLLMPSLWYEGFPMVLVEAFALGLPVICSKLGGMAEIVNDQQHGLHFATGDSADLAEKAQWLYDNHEQCKLMKNNVRQAYMDNYTSDNNYQQLIRIYQEVINEQTL